MSLKDFLLCSGEINELRERKKISDLDSDVWKCTMHVSWAHSFYSNLRRFFVLTDMKYHNEETCVLYRISMKEQLVSHVESALTVLGVWLYTGGTLIYW
jgi:hypothetical protein